MTVYEKLSSDIDNLRKAGDSCMANGKVSMAIIWYTHAAQLIDQQDHMPVDVAGSRV